MRSGIFDLAGAFRSAALVFGIELVVARVTAHEVTLHDVVVSGAAWLVVAGVLCVVVGLLQGKASDQPAGPRDAERGVVTVATLRRWLAAVGARSPVILVASSFLIPVAVGRAGAMSVAVLCLVALIATPPALGRRGFPSVPEVVFSLLAVTVLAFVLDGRGWPELTRYWPVAVLWVLGAGAARRPVLIGIWVVVAGLAVMTREPARVRFDPSLPTSRASAPDIFLLTLDTLRRDVAFEMASFRAVAEQGVLFEAAQSSAPWTLPSMATIMTGLPPRVHGALHAEPLGASRIDSELQPLAERLGELGYDTAAVVGANPYVGQRFGFRRGFATFEHPSAGSRNPLPRGFTISDLVRPLMARILRRRTGLSVWTGEDVVDRFGDIMSQRRDRPLFVWMHFMDCHGPYQHISDLSPDVRANLVWGPIEEQEELLANRPDRQAADRAAYFNEARHLDLALQRFLKEAEGLSTRGAIVVMVADHGEELFEHGRFAHGHQFYETLIGVPLVVRGLPGAVAGSRVETLVGTEDILPTLLRAAGGDARKGPAGDGPDPFRGDLLRPDPSRIRTSQNLLHVVGTPPVWAARRGRWKAVYRLDGPPALFDLSEDPDEYHDLAPRHPEIVEALRPDGSDLTTSVERVPAALNDSEREALRQLGYGP